MMRGQWLAAGPLTLHPHNRPFARSAAAKARIIIDFRLSELFVNGG